MRLLELDSNDGLIMTEDLIKDIPTYAILSHTWGADRDEVTFKDLQSGPYKIKVGYEKIRRCGEQARRDHLRHIWVDTCCIDKSSSAELTESINSMYRWYERAKVCYVFLSDLSASTPLETGLKNCRWLSRGWTLQELVAPMNVHFFDQDWTYRGSKQDIVEILSQTTGIGTGILRHEQRLSSLTVAQRMAWAAHRTSTRIEDTAYSLLGIFDVNMPLLYGEGPKAFWRLQEEIIKSRTDFSIFAWTMPIVPQGSSTSPTDYCCGVLAEAPSAFVGCKAITRKPGYGGQQFWMSNNGIKTRIQLLSEPIPGEKGFRYILPLDCYLNPQRFLGVRLRKCGPDQFVRADPWSLVEDLRHCHPSGPREKLLLARLEGMSLIGGPRLSHTSLFIGKARSCALQIRPLPKMVDLDGWPWSRFDDEDQAFFVNTNSPGEWDACSMKFRANFGFQFGRQTSDVQIDCMFYAVGWSATEASGLQCTLVDCHSFPKTLDELQSYLVSWNPDRRQIMKYLKWHQIPKCSSASFEIPGSTDRLVLSFKPSLITDRRICHGQFWRINFSYDICKYESPSPVAHEKWILEGDWGQRFPAAESRKIDGS